MWRSCALHPRKLNYDYYLIFIFIACFSKRMTTFLMVESNKLHMMNPTFMYFGRACVVNECVWVLHFSFVIIFLLDHDIHLLHMLRDLLHIFLLTLWCCILMCPKKFQVLGSGFEVISVGKKKLVRSVPTELNKDHNEILELAQVMAISPFWDLLIGYPVTCKYMWPTFLHTLLPEEKVHGVF